MKVTKHLFWVLAITFSHFTVAIPEIEHWVTPNGARVYFVAAPEIPIVDIRFVFSAGSARDAQKPGLANLASQLAQEGAGDLDSNEFNEQLAQTGAIFSTGALRDMAWISLRSLSGEQYLEPALGLLQSVLSRPRFDTEPFERRRATALIALKRDKQSPAAITSKAFYKEIYGDHPYATPTTGTQTSVESITLDDVRAFREQFYVANNATLAIVGALDKKQATALALRLSAGLKPGEKPANLPPVLPLQASVEQFIDHPSIQSHVRIGQPGMKRGDADYFPLLVGNHVLGGSGLVSILFDEIREKRGLSYSASSHFSPMAELGPFAASLQTDNSQAAEAIAVMREEIRKFVDKGPTAAALDAAKQNLIGGFPLRISSNAKTVEYLTMIGFYDLPLDYLKTFSSQVAAIRIDDVKTAFKRRLDPDKMVLVVVGKKGSDPKSKP